MKIKAEALIDYLACPMKHHYRHVEDIKPLERKNRQLDENELEVLFDRELHKVAYHLFNYVQDSKYPSEYLLRKKWGNIWVKQRSMEDLMNGVKQVKRAEYNFPRYLERLGIEVIERLHKNFKGNPGIPFFVGKRAFVQIGSHEVEVAIDLIREVDGKLELLEFNTGMNTKVRTAMLNRPIGMHVEHDLQATLSALAFEQLTGEKLDRITYYDFLSDRMVEAQRTERDYQNAEKILDQVATAMDAGICYPVMNNHCQSCPFQIECKAGDWYKERIE